MHQLIKQIEQWAEDRNNPEMIKDTIGDCFVVLTILNRQIRTGYCIADEYNNPIFSRLLIDDLILETLTCLGEMSHNIMWKRSDIRLLKCIVCCLYHISNRINLDFIDCVQHAYDQIKDRKGEMRDGVWLKSEDL